MGVAETFGTSIAVYFKFVITSTSAVVVHTLLVNREDVAIAGTRDFVWFEWCRYVLQQTSDL